MSTSRKGKRVAVVAVAVGLVVLGVAGWIGWPWLQFWWRFEPLGFNAQGFPEYRHRATGIVMVRLPGGTFWMGAQKEDPEGQNYDPDAKENEGPVHQVTLSPFLIAKYEVTQAEWKRVVGSNPSDFQGDDLPVEQVSWDDIQEFEASTGLTLPTEAQWEHACRGGSHSVYCFGGDPGRLGEYCWYDDNSGNSTHPVGQKRPNDFGLFDMHGNVWEWCEDVYAADFYSRPEARGPDPLCTSGSVDRVFRGGGWGYDARRCRSAFRLWIDPWYRFLDLGFRPSAPSP